MRAALLDAGPLVALFDAQEVAHAHYRALLADASTKWQLCTTLPCIVEASHLLASAQRYVMLSWVAQGGVSVYPIDPMQLTELVSLMRKYTQQPRTEMDLADASLVWLAEETGVSAIMTLDVRDFSRYRLPDGRGFEIL